MQDLNCFAVLYFEKGELYVARPLAETLRHAERIADAIGGVIVPVNLKKVPSGPQAAVRFVEQQIRRDIEESTRCEPDE